MKQNTQIFEKNSKLRGGSIKQNENFENSQELKGRSEKVVAALS
jgi:hypothetical protein